MSDAALVARMTLYGLKGLHRNARVLIFTIVFPAGSRLSEQTFTAP